jgi:hypothetical protein
MSALGDTVIDVQFKIAINLTINLNGTIRADVTYDP